MYWEEYLIGEESGSEPKTENDYSEIENGKGDNKSVSDYQLMSNKKLQDELARIQSTTSTLKEMQAIGQNVDEGLEIMRTDYKKIKTIIERKRNC